MTMFVAFPLFNEGPILFPLLVFCFDYVFVFNKKYLFAISLGHVQPKCECHEMYSKRNIKSNEDSLA